MSETGNGMKLFFKMSLMIMNSFKNVQNFIKNNSKRSRRRKCGSTPPEISGTTKGMTMKFLPDVGVYKEVRNQKIFLT